VGKTLGLEGDPVSRVEKIYSYPWLRQQLPGPGFINTSYSHSEGVSALYNNSTLFNGSYGGTLGTYSFGPLAVGSLATWLTAEERKLCRIRFIQRAIDSYHAVQAGLSLDEGCGVLPGYSTMITIAGVMLEHEEMISVNEGVNGVAPWWIFADYATTFHTEGIPKQELVPGESQEKRLDFRIASGPTFADNSRPKGI